MRFGKRNFFENLPDACENEIIQEILNEPGVRIERIVSEGQSSEPGFWYDQPHNEWVILLKGAARVCFKDHDDLCELKPGDYLSIPAHVKHRVEWTDPKQQSIWLAVFY